MAHEPRNSADFVISHDLEDLLTPGVAVEVDAEEAESSGAFEELALSEEAAAEGNLDLAELARGE